MSGTGSVVGRHSPINGLDEVLQTGGEQTGGDTADLVIKTDVDMDMADS